MLLKTTEIEIPEDDPFKNDTLQHKENAEIMTALASKDGQNNISAQRKLD